MFFQPPPPPSEDPSEGLFRRFSLWRERQLARNALAVAGEPGLVLDMPCRAGRFWSVLAEHGNRVILAADPSSESLASAATAYPPQVLQRIRTFQAPVLATGLTSNSVDCIFSMRLLHQIEDSEERLAILREFQRVSRDTVILSLWVDGNFKAWRRKRRERLLGASGNRFVVSKACIEAEFQTAGFDILAHQDLVPGIAMWRVYVLRKRS
ncbi:class I SAM-dependent methyltransferase [Pseudomonas akapageensis]|uniref:class I SAM-dependent methyltransferase n=1 Tax=Pseudomonas akapageensis TaxID=2609961 RepID=UPI0014074F76|nr:methyltransferase domain-containing protein [Pseudomonas akapageensis]